MLFSPSLKCCRDTIHLFMWCSSPSLLDPGCFFFSPATCLFALLSSMPIWRFVLCSLTPSFFFWICWLAFFFASVDKLHEFKSLDEQLLLFIVRFFISFPLCSYHSTLFLDLLPAWASLSPLFSKCFLADMRKKCESSCQMLWGRCNPRCASHVDCSVSLLQHEVPTNLGYFSLDQI